MEDIVRCIAEYDDTLYPPLLRLYIHDAPHRRMHTATIQRYREILYDAACKAKIRMPIAHQIDLVVYFFDPSSPDLDNLITALYQAIDGKTLKKPSIMQDDGYIQKVTMSKMFPNAKPKFHVS